MYQISIHFLTFYAAENIIIISFVLILPLLLLPPWLKGNHASPLPINQSESVTSRFKFVNLSSQILKHRRGIFI